MMSEWVWSCDRLKILLLITSFCHNLLEAKFLSLWHQKATRRINMFCNRGKQQVLSPDQATSNIFSPLISESTQITPMREKPA